ncbi:MAG: SUMF1/EgtB/PvdO family nonheme iron enzyme, partial [Pseudomonadota bacterium]
FDGETEYEIQRRHVQEPVPDLRTMVPSLSPSLCGLVMKALEKKPDDRFDGCGDFLQYISDYESGPARSQPQGKTGRNSKDITSAGGETPLIGTEKNKPSQPKRKIFIFAGLLIIILGLYVFWQLGARQTRMEAEFDKIQRDETGSQLSESEKEAAWSSFLSVYSDNNFLSTQDESMRAKGRERAAYWKQKAYAVEQARLAEERKRLEEERQRLVEEKARLEEERLRKVEEEKQRLASSPTGKGFTNSIGQKFVLIPAGTFTMGSPESESFRRDNERQHRVTISQAFYMQTTEVTQGQWRSVLGNNPAAFSSCGDDCPVESVSWEDAQAFIRSLNAKEGVGKYRLPTEAEWEYAARAGAGSAYCCGDSESNLGDFAWYNYNSGGETHPVGRKPPNAWGLYDVHGNVWEWCEDRYGDYASGDVVNPRGSSSLSFRVGRGGGWSSSPRLCRAALRNRGAPEFRNGDLGFRLAITP